MGAADRDVCSLLDQFADAECAKKALEQLNGFELAGRPMKVGHVTERGDSAAPSFLDSEEQERSGADLGNPGGLQMMARLSEGEMFSLQFSQVGVLLLICALPVHRYGPSHGSFSPAGSADEWGDCYRSNGGGFRSAQLRTAHLWLSQLLCCSADLHQGAPRLPNK